jgi:O-antigen/teichoic acid export membrane protein
MSTDATQGERKATAGRGVLYIAFAKFYFLFAGMAVQFRLPAILSRAEFGRFSLVNYIVSWFNNVAVTGTIQSVSRYSAQEPDKARLVQAAGLRMHARIGLPIALAFIAAGPLVARYVLEDASKTAPLMLAGCILGIYSFYAVFIGTANGTHAFHKQAGLDITSATLRVIGLLGTAMAGLGVVGVISGWVAASLLVFSVSILWVGLPRTGGERLPVAPMVKFFGGVAVYLLLFNGLMFVDTILLGRLMTEHYASHADVLAGALDHVLPWASSATGYHPSPSALADVQVGYYSAVQNLARVSYQAIIAATFVVFPLVSRSTFTDEQDTTKKYIQVTLRYSLMFAMAIAVAMMARPKDMMGVLYQAEFAELGGPALAVLALGNVAFAMFAIAGTILNSAGHSRPAIISAAITLALATVGNYIAISMAADSANVMLVAASVTSAAMAIGAVISLWQLRRLFGASLPLLSIVRIAVAAAVAFVIGRVLPLHGKLMTLVAAALIAGTFLVLLVASRELDKRDLEAIKAVRRKRAPGGEAA